MGLEPIDQHLGAIIHELNERFDLVALEYIKSLSKVLGCAFAMCMASYESYMMILGRRGLDVMRILRIIGFSLCISLSNHIVVAVGEPGRYLQAKAQGQWSTTNEGVKDRLVECSKEQKQYADSLRAKIDTITERQKQMLIADQHAGNDDGWLDEMVVSIKQAYASAEGEIKKFVVSAETLFAEFVNEGIRFIGEIIYQVVFFAMLLGCYFMLKVLAAFCPLAFALSIIPPWSSAWSQWISKYVSISLWGFLLYSCGTMVNFIFMYEINTDISAYQTLLGKNALTGEWMEIGMLGLQNIGATCRYIMALLIGSVIIKFVPEIASWLIPGGASSSIGSAMGGMVQSAGAVAVGSTINIAKGGSKIAVGGTKLTASVANTAGGAAMGAIAGAAKNSYAGAKIGLGMATKAGSNTAGQLMAMSVLGVAGAVGGGLSGGLSGGKNGALGMAKQGASSAMKGLDKLSMKK